MEERSSEEDSDRNFRNFNKRKLDTDIAQEFDIFTNLYEGEKKVRQHYENNFERTSRIEKLLRNNHWKRRKENYDLIEIRYVPS